MKRRIFIVVGMCILLSAGSAMGATFNKLEDKTVAAGQQVSLSIVVDDSTDTTGVAGAAFTISYDTSVFTGGTVTSTYFDTFANQFTAINPDYSGPTQAETGETQPVVENEVTTETPTGLMVAAARARAADPSASKMLFTFTATVDSNATPGNTYTIEIIPTTLDNESAGYAAEGENIDLLVSADETVVDPAATNAFPVLLSAVDHVPGDTSGTMTISSVLKGDVTGDGEITGQDAVEAFKLSLKPTWTDDELAVADWNNDGQITGRDAVDIFYAQF